MTINHFFEVKRKDFVEMLLHHVTTLGLILFSWFVNFTRFGVLVMVLHDVSDVFLEVGKICIYMGMDTAKDIIFVVFALTFFVTRLVMYVYIHLYYYKFNSIQQNTKISISS